MKYLFILGRTPALSLAEALRAVPGAKILSLAAPAAEIECDPLTPGFLNLLGGTIKIAEVIGDYKHLGELTPEILRDAIPAREGRIIFGISAYGNFSGLERRTLYLAGLGLKKTIKAEGRRARLVVSHEAQLSSVVVAKNKLVEEGAEIMIMKNKNKTILGRTIAVQAFEAYGERDFDRPGRSARRGMLPPKLSQMMVNIAGGKRESLLDPFCGSGTVLGEALLLGYRKVVGADLSDEAVTDTAAYIKWLEEKNPALAGRARVIAADARLADQVFSDEKFDAIVAEPYLGAPQSGRETPTMLKKTMDELIPLYAAALKSLSKILSPDGAIVFAFPVFGKGRERLFAPLAEIIGDLKVEPLLPDEYAYNLSLSDGIVYERPDQHVAREIILLKKNDR